MGIFDYIMDDILGINPPQAPAMPSILSTPPQVSPAAKMPSLGILTGAGAKAAAAATSRSGRASTILTSRKKRAAKSTGGLPSYDTYSGITL